MKNKKRRTKVKQRFLLETFFNDLDQPDGYTWKVVGNFVLVKQFNKNTKEWIVAIWEKDKWDEYQKNLPISLL